MFSSAGACSVMIWNLSSSGTWIMSDEPLAAEFKGLGATEVRRIFQPERPHLRRDGAAGRFFT
jgi:hypothetical protein